MTHFKWLNFPAFDQAQFDLEVRGHAVLTPANLDREFGFDPMKLWPDGLCDWSKPPAILDKKKMIKLDIDALLECNCVCLLPGWRDSIGAKAEYGVAVWADIKVKELNELLA